MEKYLLREYVVKIKYNAKKRYIEKISEAAIDPVLISPQKFKISQTFGNQLLYWLIKKSFNQQLSNSQLFFFFLI